MNNTTIIQHPNFRIAINNLPNNLHNFPLVSHLQQYRVAERIPLDSDGDPNYEVEDFYGNIETAEGEFIGTFSFEIWDFPQIKKRHHNDREHLFMHFDGQSASRVEIYHRLSEMPQIRRPTLAIEALGILPKFRNQGIGTQTLKSIMAFAKGIAGCERAILKPFPLEIEDKKAHNYEGIDFKPRLHRLKKLYARLGFKAIDNSYMASSITESQDYPEAQCTYLRKEAIKDSYYGRHKQAITKIRKAIKRNPSDKRNLLAEAYVIPGAHYHDEYGETYINEFCEMPYRLINAVQEVLPSVEGEEYMEWSFGKPKTSPHVFTSAHLILFTRYFDFEPRNAFLPALEKACELHPCHGALCLFTTRIIEMLDPKKALRFGNKIIGEKTKSLKNLYEHLDWTDPCDCNPWGEEDNESDPIFEAS